MGEIKSTLDLVMARTEHLKLSETDRQEQAQGRFKARLKGLLQKFFDQALGLEELERALADLEVRYDMDCRLPATQDLLERIAPGKDNQAALTLLAGSLRVDTGGLRQVLEQYRAQRAASMKDHSDRLKQTLADDRGITGSAVFPNLDRDEQWNEALETLNGRCESLLAQEKQKIVGDLTG